MVEQLHVGWLGTGRMGSAMADRLIDAGYRLTVWNRTSAKAQPLVERGASQVTTASALAACDVVFVCVTRSEDLTEVLTGPDGLLSADRPPPIVVDCSTVSTEASAAARAGVTALGAVFIAAPVSGNPAMVASGSAAIAASGPADQVERLRPVLSAIAPVLAYVGPGEQARLVKIAHNLLLGVLTQALSEATSLVVKAGVPAAEFIGFIDGSVLGSTFLHHKGRAIVDAEYAPTFTAINLRKDYDVGMAAARAQEVPVPLMAATYQLLQTVIGRGLGELDYVALHQIQSEGAGLVWEAAR